MTREEKFLDAFINGDEYPEPVTREEEYLKGTLEKVEQGKVSKVPAPQYIVDENGYVHWNTGKYDYISYIEYIGDNAKKGYYISHDEPLILNYDNDSGIYTLTYPSEYEILDTSGVASLEEYNEINITGHYNLKTKYMDITVDNYTVWPRDYVKQSNYDMHIHEVTYNGNTYISQREDSEKYLVFYWLLTDNGLFQILRQDIADNGVQYRINYNSNTGTVESYCTMSGKQPISFSLIQYDTTTGEMIQEQDNITSFVVGKNLKKISTNGWFFKDKKDFKSKIVVNDFNDYWYKSDVDTTPTKNSANLLTSGSVYEHLQPYVVTFSYDGDSNIICDRTITEISKANQNNKWIVGKLIGADYTNTGSLAVCNDTETAFRFWDKYSPSMISDVYWNSEDNKWGCNDTYLASDNSPTDFVLYTHHVVDDLLSPEINSPLSANQGKVLKDLVDKKVNITDIADDLTTNDGNKPLSANQGVVLNDKIEKAVSNAEKKYMPINSIICTSDTLPIDASDGVTRWCSDLKMQVTFYAEKWYKPDGTSLE